MGPHATELRKSELLEEGNSLRCRFQTWERQQLIHMPSVVAHRQSLDDGAGAGTDEIKGIRLFLPSEIVGEVPCPPRLIEYEFQYRIVQAHTTLRELKEEIVVRTHMINSKKKYSHGTAQMTRSNTKIQTKSQGIRDIASKYRTIRMKLLALSNVLKDFSWAEVLKELDDADIRGLTSQEVGGDGRERRLQLGEGHKKLTWIWTVVKPVRATSYKGPRTRNRPASDVPDDDWASESDSDSELEGDGLEGEERGEHRCYHVDDPALRIEFCRTRARAHRWQEECILLAEEMMRVEQFWAWDAARWEQRALDPSVRVAIPLEDSGYPELVERRLEAAELLKTGKVAYALRQASIRRGLESRARANHADLLAALSTFTESGVVRDGKVMVECAGYQGDNRG
jgi:hypothetical protein